MKIQGGRTTRGMMACCCAGLLAVLLAQASPAAETVEWVQEPKLSFNKPAKTWTVMFELGSLSDVEVAIVAPGKPTTRGARHILQL